MGKKIYLTFDIETIMARKSASNDYYTAVFLGALFLAEELKQRDLKATFFISLSPKTLDISYVAYSRCIELLLGVLKQYDNLLLAPHIHALNLPVDFECSFDYFSKYTYDQQVSLLYFAKEFFMKRGICTDVFRPGGFLVNDSYYKALNTAGFKYSSVMLRDKQPVENMITGEIEPILPYLASGDVVEYPLTSVFLKSIKQKKELLNFSPDFFSLSSIKYVFENLEYVCLNYHSFSVFLNRFLRENHKGQNYHNLMYLLFKRNLDKFLAKYSIYTRNDDTMTKNELIRWFDYIVANNYQTYFIGE